MRARLVLLLAFLALALAACTPDPIKGQRPKGSLAVAGFTSPRFNWELLAGNLPDENRPVKQETLYKLDQVVQQTLSEHEVSGYMSPTLTRQCQEIVVFEQISRGRESAFKYWTGVGACMNADYILVPQALAWQEREGGEYGSNVPAGVVLDLFLVEVKTRRIAARYHYDKTQQALTDNLLKAGEYFKRGGKWVTALELSREGINLGLMEMGL